MVPPPAGADGVVVGDPALCVGSAEAGTGIPTALLHARCGLAALGADQALWSAVGWGANHGNLTGAHTYSVLFLMLAVGAARIGITRIRFFNYRYTSRHQGALGDCISDIAIETGADGGVADSVADGVDPTDSWAGVDTLVVDTGAVAWAVSVMNTLWPAGQVRVSKISRNTVTGSSTLARPALGI